MSSSSLELDFTRRLDNIRLAADELPVSVIIHRTDDMYIVYMNKTGLEGLGTTLEALQDLRENQYHVKYFNTEDSDDYVPKLMHIIRSRLNEKVSYFQQVRTPDCKEWQLYVSNTKVFARNEAGDTTHMITVAGLLDPVHHITAKVNRLLEEISFLRLNNPLFLKLTKREKEILAYMASGMNSGEIAEKTFTSIETVNTHRKNIRNKLELKNNYDAVKFAQAYNLM